MQKKTVASRGVTLGDVRIMCTLSTMPRVNGQPICTRAYSGAQRANWVCIRLLWEIKIFFSGQGRAGETTERRSETGPETKKLASRTSIIALAAIFDARPLCFSVALAAIAYYNPTSGWEKRARLRRRLRRELGDQLLKQKAPSKPVAPRYSAKKPSSGRPRTRAAPRCAAHTRITAV